VTLSQNSSTTVPIEVLEQDPTLQELLEQDPMAMWMGDGYQAFGFPVVCG
jgi:hypothetical protein